MAPTKSDKKPKKAQKSPGLSAETLTVDESEAVAPTPVENRKPRKPQPQDIKLSARQFVRARQYRWDRSAGFLADMKRNHGPNARLTRPEWDAHWDAFWARPVK
jgi:hypothetical protein